MSIPALLIGQSGYIAQNLLRAAGGREFVATSTKQLDAPNCYQVDLSRDRLSESHALARARFSEIFILARPPTTQFEANRRFYSNLQRALLLWCKSPELRRIHFLSTSLVYSGAVDGSGAVGPYGTYEYFKLETEEFLRYVHLCVRPDIHVVIYRLPIGCGGHFDKERNANQFIYSFIEAYRQGHHWQFDNDIDLRFGTSWFHVGDFASRVLELPQLRGTYECRNVSSGFFTYKEIHDHLLGRLGTQFICPLHLHRSRFEVIDQLAMPRRSVWDEIDKVLASS